MWVKFQYLIYKCQYGNVFCDIKVKINIGCPRFFLTLILHISNLS